MRSLLASVVDWFLAAGAVAIIAFVTLLVLLARWLSLGCRWRRKLTFGAAPAVDRASIVVVAQEGTLVERSIGSLLEAIRFAGGSHQVAVVGTISEQVQRAAVERFPAVKFHVVSEPGEGLWNAAIGVAESEVVVLLSEHVVVDPSFLNPLLECLSSPQVFAVGCYVQNGDGTEPSRSAGKTRGRLRNGKLHIWHSPTSNGDRQPEPVLWISRSCCAYRKARLLELGGFDSLYASDEVGDIDICFRAWKRGWQVLIEPRSSVRWLGQRCSNSSSVTADVVQGELLVWAWSNLAQSWSLLCHQLALAAELLCGARDRRLNLRPLRYALVRLPRLLPRVLAASPCGRLSDEEVFRISSHRYLLSRWCATHDPPQVDKGREHERVGGQMPEDRPAGRMEERQAPSVQESPGATGLPPKAGWGLAESSPSFSQTAALRILMVCPQLPYPPTHGAAVRMWNLLKMLSAVHQIDVLSFAEPSLSDEQIRIATEKLRSCCGSVRVVVRRPVDLRRSLLDRSIHVEMFDCDEMRDQLLEMVARGGYDIVQFDKTELAQYALPRPAPVQLLVEHVVFYHAYRRQFLQRRQRSPAHILEYLKLRRYELGACSRFDGVITMSRVDARLLRSRLPRHPCITDVPNGADTDYYRFSPRLAQGNDLLFVGNFDHSPNVDGVRFFLREVFPLVKASVAETRLFVVGPGPYHALPEVAADPSVIATGFVDDTRVYMERCVVFVAPILAGGGTRVKILEAMSAGIPVVSTTVGAEGLDVTPGTHLLIGDSPRAFAEAVIRLLHNPDMRQRLRSNARSLVETHYSWPVIGERLERVYRELLAKRGCAAIS